MNQTTNPDVPSVNEELSQHQTTNPDVTIDAPSVNGEPSQDQANIFLNFLSRVYNILFDFFIREFINWLEFDINAALFVIFMVTGILVSLYYLIWILALI